jgi:hypothetical protein
MNLSVVKAEDCTYIRLYDSEDLTAYYSSPAGKTVTLGITLDCGTEVVKDVQQSDVLLDIETSTAYISIDKDFINGTDGDTTALDDCIYRLRLVISETDGSKEEDYICTAILCETECSVITYIASNLTSNLYDYIIALQNIENCSKCKCEDACVIFNKLKEILSTDEQNSCS